MRQTLVSAPLAKATLTSAPLPRAGEGFLHGLHRAVKGGVTVAALVFLNSGTR